MKFLRIGVVFVALSLALAVNAQQATQTELKIDSTNRTLTVT